MTKNPHDKPDLERLRLMLKMLPDGRTPTRATVSALRDELQAMIGDLDTGSAANESHPTPPKALPLPTEKGAAPPGPSARIEASKK